MARIVAFTNDLMDRSRLSAAIPELEMVRTPEDAAGAACVVVDLASHGASLPAIRAAAPHARLVAYGPHVDEAALAAADAAGADAVLPRSRFFRDPRSQVTGDDSPRSEHP
jgi:hypothetical protein